MNRIVPEFPEWGPPDWDGISQGTSDLGPEDGRLQVTTEKVIEAFYNIEDGKIPGLGVFSLRPMRHRCTLDDSVLCLLCG